MRKLLFLIFFCICSFAISESAIDKRSGGEIKYSLLKNRMDIFDLIKYEDSQTILNRLSEIKNVNIFNTFSQSLLHLAVLYRKYPVVRYLLKRGAKVYLQDANGDTPLHIAVRNGNEAFIKALLFSPSSLNALFIKNKNSLTPLDIALKRGDKRVLSILEHFFKRDDVDDIFFERELKKKDLFKNSLRFKGSRNFGNANIKIEGGRTSF